MPAENEFLIKIKTLLEDSGVKLTEEQLKQIEDQVKKGGKAAHEAGISHKELHEALKLAAVGAGDALGPIGELAHFLGNPYIMAAAGATLAIKLLVEQNHALHENLVKNIELSQQVREMFENNLNAAVLSANEQLAKFHVTLGMVLERQDRLAEHMKNDTETIHAQADAVKSLASAEEALANARAESLHLSGMLNDPELNQQHGIEHRKARDAEQQAQRAATEEEIEIKRHGANAAQQQSDKATADADKLITERATREAAINDAKGIATKAEKDLEEANKKLAEAKANQKEGPGVGYRINKVEFANRQSELDKKVEQAETEVEKQKGVIKSENKRASDLTIDQNKGDAEITRLTSWAEHLKEVADQSKRAADEQERLQSIHNRTEDKVNAINDETDNVNRRNYLQGRIQGGKATPDETAEWNGSQESGVARAIRDTNAKINAIHNNVYGAEGGHASDDEKAQLIQLNERLIGLLENWHGVTQSNQSAISTLQHRISILESTHLTNRAGPGM